MHAAMIDTGRVSPVITVERQEFKKVKTTSTVRKAPIKIVDCTSSTESRIQIELSRTTESVTPSGRRAFSSSTRSRTASATSTVLAPETFRRSKPTAGTPLTSAAERGSSASSRTTPRSLKRIGTPARLVTTKPSKSCAVRRRPVTRTSVSFGPNSTRPAGTSRFSARSVCMTKSSGTACAASFSGASSTTTARVSPPTSDTCPTPLTPSSSRRSSTSAKSVSSRSERASERSASERIGSCSGSKRWTSGCSMSCGSTSRIASIFARTSCCATAGSVPSSNSMKIDEKPSDEVEVRVRTPSIGLTASSMRRVTSRSTVSGEAPLYSVCTAMKGNATSGHSSIERRR